MAREDIGGVDSAELAAQAARDAISGSTFSGVERPAEEAPEEPQVPLNEAGEEEAPEYEESQEHLGEETLEPAQEEEYEEVEFDENYERLRAVGIDLGVTRAEIPQEVRPVYDNLVNQALLAAEAYENRTNQLAESQAEIQQFAQRLQENPQKILLTLALTAPEAFSEAVSTFEEMQSDARMKDVILRELRAEATLSAAQRAQQLQHSRVQQQQIQRVTNATHQAAERYGVDAALAEEFVASKITQLRAQGQELNMSMIPQIVSRLKPAQPVKKVATAQKLKQQKRAPAGSVEGHGAPPPSAVRDESSPGLTQVSSNPMMDLVKAASRRISQGIAGE